MLTINGTTISMIRGDTAAIKLDITVNGNQYNYSSEDKLIFSVKKSYTDNVYALQKKMTGPTLVIDHSETNNLDVGTYVYDIQVILANGQVLTYGPGNIIITADITRD